MIVNLDRIKQIESLKILDACCCYLCYPVGRSINNISSKNFSDIDYLNLAGNTIVYYFKNSSCCICFWQIGFDCWETFFSNNGCPYEAGIHQVEYITFDKLFDNVSDEIREELIFNLDLFTRESNENN